jgi:hypothetical protein
MANHRKPGLIGFMRHALHGCDVDLERFGEFYKSPWQPHYRCRCGQLWYVHPYERQWKNHRDAYKARCIHGHEGRKMSTECFPAGGLCTIGGMPVQPFAPGATVLFHHPTEHDIAWLTFDSKDHAVAWLNQSLNSLLVDDADYCESVKKSRSLT